jgi:DHA2 family multidrug resistance protein
MGNELLVCAEKSSPAHSTCQCFAGSGPVFLAFTMWQLSFLTLSTPYGWLQVLSVIRDPGPGVVIQPLSVSAVSDLHSRKFTHSSMLYTIMRFVSTSLGIAVLTTLMQTQAKIHSGHLAEQVTPASSPGQLAARLQAFLVQHGVGMVNARAAALQAIARLVQRQGYCWPSRTLSGLYSSS